MNKTMFTGEIIKQTRWWAAFLLCLSLSVRFPLITLVADPAIAFQPVRTYLPMLTRALAYVESTGILDPAFGNDGRVMTDLTETEDEGLSLAIQHDGRLLVGGEVGVDADYDVDMAVARYNPDGSLDNTFGSGGWVRTDLDGWNDSASDIILQPDGKILQSGSSRGDFTLVRYNPDGSLDATFANGLGWVRTDMGGLEDESKTIALQPDGKIVVGGYALDGLQYDFALVRYNADGSLDSSFGGDGIVTTDLTGDQDQGQALVILPDGKILLVGSVKRDAPYYRDFGMVRYLPDGTIDLSFGISGRVITDINGGRDFAYAVTLQPDGTMVLAGTAQDGPDGDYDFALVRYTSTGYLDTSFSSNGKLVTDFTGGDDDAYGVTLQPDGKVIAAGYANTGSSFDFALVRYLTNGDLDPTFGSGGMLTSDFMLGDDLGLAVALQADGKIVLAGNAYNGLTTDFALARYK